MREAVAWAIYGVLTGLAVASGSVSTFFVIEFFQLREETAISTRMPHITVMQLMVTLVPLVFDVVSIPLDILGFEDKYAPFLAIRVLWLLSFVTMKITRIWCFNWRYTLTRHEMETLWKSQMQLKESHSWAVRYSSVFSDWKRALLVSFGVATLLFAVCVGLVFALTKSRTDTAIGGITAFVLLHIPSFWALHRSKECRDIHGVRKQLEMEVYLVAATLVIAGALVPLPSLSLAHRFATFSIDIAFIAVYFFATTRFQLWKLQKSVELLHSKRSAQSGVKHLRLNTTSATNIAVGQRTDALKCALSDYSCFELLAEHCLRELALKHLFFVVAYMRLKEYLFRFFKAEDLFDDAGERFEENEMLQQVLRNTTFSRDELKPTSSLLLEKLKRTPQPSISDGRGFAQMTLATAMSSLTPPSPPIESAKENYKYNRQEMGCIVELPIEVLQLEFAEYSLDGCVKAVRELFAKYMDYDSEYCINVSSASRKRALSSLSTLTSADLADERTESLLDCIRASDGLLAEVIQLLKRDSFSRFSRAAAYQKWLVTPK